MGTRPTLSNRLLTAIDPRAGSPMSGVSSWREAGISWVGRTPHLLACTVGDGADVTHPPRVSSPLRHGQSAVGSLCPVSFMETGRCRGSGKGGGAPRCLLCPLLSHAPAALGWPSLPPKHLASASWLTSRSPSLSLLPVRTCVGTESLQGRPPS